MADCEFMRRQEQAGMVVEICEISQGICRVDPATSDYKCCARRQSKLDQIRDQQARAKKNHA